VTLRKFAGTLLAGFPQVATPQRRSRRWCASFVSRVRLRSGSTAPRPSLDVGACTASVALARRPAKHLNQVPARRALRLSVFLPLNTKGIYMFVISNIGSKHPTLSSLNQYMTFESPKLRSLKKAVFDQPLVFPFLKPEKRLEVVRASETS